MSVDHVKTRCVSGGSHERGRGLTNSTCQLLHRSMECRAFCDFKRTRITFTNISPPEINDYITWIISLNRRNSSQCRT